MDFQTTNHFQKDSAERESTTGAIGLGAIAGQLLFRPRRHRGAPTRTGINSGLCNSSAIKLSSSRPRHRGELAHVLYLTKLRRPSREWGRCWTRAGRVASVVPPTIKYRRRRDRHHDDGEDRLSLRPSIACSSDSYDRLLRGQSGHSNKIIIMRSTTRLSRRGPAVRGPVRLRRHRGARRRRLVRLGRYWMTCLARQTTDLYRRA